MDNATNNMGPILWYALAGGEVFIRKDVPKIIDVIKKIQMLNTKHSFKWLVY